MITKEEVMKIARLAHLNISDEEVNQYAEKLGSILDYVAQLQAVDVSDVPPMSHAHGTTNVFRPDEVKPSLDIKCLQQICPEMNGRFIKVPIIVE